MKIAKSRLLLLLLPLPLSLPPPLALALCLLLPADPAEADPAGAAYRRPRSRLGHAEGGAGGPFGTAALGGTGPGARGGAGGPGASEDSAGPSRKLAAVFTEDWSGGLNGWTEGYLDKAGTDSTISFTAVETFVFDLADACTAPGLGAYLERTIPPPLPGTYVVQAPSVLRFRRGRTQEGECPIPATTGTITLRINGAVASRVTDITKDEGDPSACYGLRAPPWRVASRSLKAEPA
jgi:hypothetical protein